MPRNRGLGLDDDKGGSPVGSQPGKPNPQEAVRSAQTSVIASARALQDQERVEQSKGFSLQSCSSSAAGWHGKKQGGEEGKHAAGSLNASTLQIQLFPRERTV